jgi:PHD/YefM family antitoxin component YafN of YafNO toxin-antitoxin module
VKTERRDSSAGRVPVVAPGTAVVFTRYDDEKAVVLHPDDYRRLVELDEALEALALAGPEVGELTRLAHALEDEPGDPLEDPAAIEKLLGR